MKKLLFLSTLLLLIFQFSCAEENGLAAFQVDLIPNGYRSHQEYPLYMKSAQVRVTENALNFIENNIGNLISLAGQDFVSEPDEDGNPKIKFSLPPTYGSQLGVDYGVCSQCDEDYDYCSENCGNDDDCGNNTVTESNGGTDYGCEIEMTILKDSFEIIPITQSGTDADKLHVRGEISVNRTGSTPIKVWVDSSPLSGHTNCDIDFFGNIPIDVDVDFVLNDDNETSIEIKDLVVNLDNININPDCNWFLDLVIGLIENIVVSEVETTIQEQVDSMTETILCARCIPDYPNNPNRGYHCPINAPSGASCGDIGCSETTDCTQGFVCESGRCVANSNCETTADCPLGGTCEEETGKCVEAPFCMETEDQCWDQRLGLEGRVDALTFLDNVIETDNQSWINFYVNLGEYAKSENGGLSLGIIGGMNGDWNPCVPPSNKIFDKEIPALSTLTQNSYNGDQPYHIGVALSQYLLNQGIDSIYNSGAFCLDMDSNVSEFLSSSTFSILMPSLNDMTNRENSSIMIAVRPQKAPVITFGTGEVDQDNNPIIDQSFINLAIDDLQLNFYAFVEERYLRIATITLDLRVGINLDIDDDHNLIPVLPAFQVGPDRHIRNIRITNSEVLRESNDYLLNTLPSIIELALGLMPIGFDPIPIPDFMGFKFNILDMKMEQEGTPSEVSNFLAIYGEFSIVEPSNKLNQKSKIYGVETVKLKAVNRKELSKGKKSEVVLKVNHSGGELEYQYRLDNNFWTPYKKGDILKLKHSILNIQGVHTVDIRSRVVGKSDTTSDIYTHKVVIDSVSPYIDINFDGKKIINRSYDNVDRSKYIQYSINIDNKGWSKFDSWKDIEIPQNKKDLYLQIKAKDSSNNLTFVKKRFNFNNRTKNINKDLKTTQKTTGCSYGAYSGIDLSVFIFMFISIFILRFRKNLKRYLILLPFLLFVISCNDNTETGKCVTNSDCENGEICENNRCIETGLNCDETPDLYECSECYIDGRCGSSNPCMDGCECNETFGICEKIENYCTTDSDCGERQECKNNRCSTIRCETDQDCSYKDCSDDPHSNSYCDTVTGACLCSIPCGGSCPGGTFCCHDPEVDSCLPLPEVCESYSCDPGYEVVVISEGTVNDVTCEREGVECECRELPKLPLGIVGKYSSTAIWNNQLIVVGYNSTYGDLMLGIYDENVETLDGEHIEWYFLDGIPEDGEITNGPTGPRGGVSDKGDDLGAHTSVIVDNIGRVHIGYQDRTTGGLKYGLLTEVGDSWSFSSVLISSSGDTGYYTSITVDGDNKPSISYMTYEKSDLDGIHSSLNIAVANSNSPLSEDDWDIETLDSKIKDLPCDRGCTANQVCVFDKESVTACNENITELSPFNSQDTPANIPDDSVEGVRSYITIPSGTVVADIKVSFDITHSWRGDLIVKLYSPDGREVVLANPDDGDSGSDLVVVDRMLFQFSGTDVSGRWRLQISDTQAQDIGVLNSWSLKVNVLVDSSPYCGTVCKDISDSCEQCAIGTVCVEGECTKEAKEMPARYYYRGVGLFSTSKRYSSGHILAILYLDSIDETLKMIHYNTTTKTILESVILGSGGYHPHLAILGDIAHISYIDKANDLRYLTYQQGSTDIVNHLVDDGIRTDGENMFEIHKIGYDSVIGSDGGGFEIYYMDSTSHEIVKKVFNSNSFSDLQTVYRPFNDGEYRGTFGFYMDLFNFDGSKMLSTFYYKLKEGDSEEIPNSPGKVRIIR